MATVWNTTVRSKSGSDLDMEYALHPKDLSAVVFLHGGTRDMHADKAFLMAADELSADHTIARFSFGGHGKSTGDSTQVTVESHLQDLDAVIEWLKGRGTRRIVLVGCSMGAGIACLYASKDIEKSARIAGLFLASPAIDFKTTFIEPTALQSQIFFSAVHAALETQPYFEAPWNGFKIGRAIFDSMKKPENDPVAALKRYPGRVMAIHGTGDMDISWKDTERIMRELDNNKMTWLPLAHATHGFPEEPHQTSATQAIISFAQRCLKE